MANTMPANVEMRPTVSPSSFLGTILITIAAIIAMLFLDLFLADISRRASAAQATAEYERGQQLLAAGDAASAADHFESAVASDRQNTAYALGWSEALLSQGKLDDAESTLRTLLDRAENDGAVNLTMARVMTREGRLDEAAAYYHRAIYGQWGSDSVQERRAVRIELVDLLVRRRASRALAAELLPLEEAATDSAPLRLWIGQRFLIAGSPARAADEFRQVLRLDSRNAQAYAGLGEAALRLGNFVSAQDNLARAARLAPSDTAIATERAIVDSTLALDPTQRELGGAERAARSQRLLMRTVESVLACGVRNALADSAITILGPSKRAQSTSATERSGQQMLSMAIALWATRPAQCAVAASDRPLALVQGRLAQ